MGSGTMRHVREGLVVCIMTAVFGFATATAVAQLHPDEQTVTAVGRAVGTDLKATDEARQDAKRNAVAQACGEIINAQSTAEDFTLKKDRILANAVGYITSFKVLREWAEAGISNCEIRATVSLGRFDDDWSAMFAHIREDMANPRCVIVITEDNDVDDLQQPKVNGVCQSAIENHFLEHGVQLMDKSVVDRVRDRDMDLAALNGDVNLLAAKAASFNADVLVFGRAEARKGGPIEVGGHMVHRWDVTLNVRAVQADSGQILVSNTYRPTTPYRSTSAACGDDAFTSLAKDVAEQLLRDVAEAWRRGLTSHQIFRITWENCSRKDFRETIAPALLKVRGVQQGEEGVKLREAVNNTIASDVYWSFDLNALADAIDDLKAEGLQFEVVEQSANRIRVKVIGSQ